MLSTFCRLMSTSTGLVPKPKALRVANKNWQDKHYVALKKLLKERKVSEATSYFYEEVKNPTKPMFVMLLGEMGRAGHTRMAFKLFKHMRDRDFTPSPGSLTALFNALAENPQGDKHQALEKTKDLYDSMRLKGWNATEITYHAMIKSFAKNGDIQSAFRILDEMEANKCAITVDTYNHLLMACISDRRNGFVLALRVMRLMMWKRIRPNEVTFNNLIRSAKDCGCGETVEALNVLLQDTKKSSIKDSRVKLISAGDNLLDVRLGEDIVSVAELPATPEQRLALCGGTEGVLKQMSYFKVKPTPSTYSLLAGCLTSEESLMAFVRSIDPSSVDIGFYNQVLKKSIVERYKCVKDVKALILDSGLKPDVLTYGILAMTVSTQEEISLFLNELDQQELTCNEQILSTLLNNASRYFQYAAICKLLTYAKHNDISINEKAVKNIAVSFEKNDRVFGKSYDDAMRLLKEVRIEERKDPLKQFEPRVMKRDKTKFDPDSHYEGVLGDER